jgi:c-di-GMP-binding flagellar brake protein YcgR
LATGEKLDRARGREEDRNMDLAWKLPWLGNRRQEQRVPIKLFCEEHLKARDLQSMAIDMSERGLSLRRVGGTRTPTHEAIGLEFALPGTGEVIWAHAETQFEAIDRGVHRAGLRFLGMAGKHQRLLRDYLMDRRLRALELAPPSWRERLRALLDD